MRLSSCGCTAPLHPQAPLELSALIDPPPRSPSACPAGQRPSGMQAPMADGGLARGLSARVWSLPAAGGGGGRESRAQPAKPECAAAGRRRASSSSSSPCRGRRGPHLHAAAGKRCWQAKALLASQGPHSTLLPPPSKRELFQRQLRAAPAMQCTPSKEQCQQALMCRVAKDTSHHQNVISSCKAAALVRKQAGRRGGSDWRSARRLSIW